MLYTILICTRNRCNTLETALRSYFNLTIPHDISVEMIVVDNGSTDLTKQVVEDFKSIAPFSVLYHYESREGHSIALNSGVSSSSGETILFTDDDAFPAEDWLREVRNSFVNDHADWVFGPVRPDWGNRPEPKWYGSATAALVACLDYGAQDFVVTNEKHTFFGVNHACRSDLFKKMGGYREDLGLVPGKKGTFGNDDELFLRVLRSGHRIIYNSRAYVNHLIPPQRRSSGLHRRIAHLVAHNQYNYYKNTGLTEPSLLGIPRFFFRLPLIHFYMWTKSLLLGRASDCFYHELRFRRFATIIALAFIRWPRKFFLRSYSSHSPDS